MSPIAPSAPSIALPRAPRSLRRAALRWAVKVAGLAFLLGAPLLAPAQTLRPQRAAIRLEQVVAALNLARLPLENAEVKLMAQNTATIEAPRLEVRAVEPWGDRDARVRLGCEAHEQCLPFYVAVHWVDATLAKAALHGAILTTGHSATPISTNRGPSPVSSPAPAVTANAADAEIHIHAGSHATLLIEGERLHIKVPVICLENGVPGRTIRVTALDHKQTYRAEVVDSTLLKGTL
jgi:hypothetical protein